MSTPTGISIGSTTLVKSGPGHLYGLHVTPTQGSALVILDTLTTTNSGADLNAAVVQGTLIDRLGWSAASTTPPQDLSYYGTTFSSGLTVAASSNARVTVFTD